MQLPSKLVAFWQRQVPYGIWQRLTNPQKLALISLLIFLIALPVGIYLVQKTQIFNPRASETKTADADDLIRKSEMQSEFVLGEVIIKFKSQTRQIKIKQRATIHAQEDLEKGAVPFSTLDERSIPDVLTSINQKFKIRTIEKVFKGAEDPSKDLDKLKSALSKEVDEGARKLDEKSLLSTDFSRTYKVTFDSETNIKEIVDTYNKHADVEYIEPNFIYYITRVPNDQDFSRLWGLHNTGQTGGTTDADIDAPEAWDTTTGSSSVVVGIIDTGIDYNHQDLASNIWVNSSEVAGNGVDDDNNGYIDDVRGWDFNQCQTYTYDGRCATTKSQDNDPLDDNGHGTHVAGTIAGIGNNNSGIVGVSWQAKLMPLKFLNRQGYGDGVSVVQAIHYATLMGAKITNNSWGGGPFSQTLYDAISYANSAGALFVAAAGNASSDNDTYPSYPASYELANVISVVATDHNDRLAYFSNYGISSVHVAAPGRRIYSSIPNNNYATFSGTSMAAPHVSGAAALIWSQFPTLTPQSLKNKLLISSDWNLSLSDKTVSGGRLNIARALSSPSFYSPQEFNFTLLSDTTTQASLVITNPSRSESLQWTVSSSASWLTMPETSGNISSGSYKRVSLNINTASLATGTHSANLQLTTDDLAASSTSIPINLTVLPSATVTWIKTFGGLGNSTTQSTVVDNTGNVYVVGYFDGSVTIGDVTLTSVANKDTFIAKYTSTGDFVWARQIGGNGNTWFSDMFSKVVVDQSNNVYVVLQFGGSLALGSQTLTSAGDNDILLIKYNSTGEIVWIKQDGGTGTESINSIATDGSGNIYIAGAFTGTTRFDTQTFTSRGGYDIFMAKYTNDGNLVWVKQAGGTSSDDSYTAAVDNSGNLYLVGTLGGSTTFDTFTLISGAYIVKYDSFGNAVWAKIISPGSYRGYAVSVDTSGNVYAIGTYYGTASFDGITLFDGFEDHFIVKYTGQGNAVWAKKITAQLYEMGDSRFSSITVDASGNIYLTGDFTDHLFLEGGPTLITSNWRSWNVAIIKYDAMGNLLWAKHEGRTAPSPYVNVVDSTHAGKTAMDNSGNFYVLGNLSGQAEFGSQTITSDDRAGDGFVIKYTTAGSQSPSPTPTPSPIPTPLPSQIIQVGIGWNLVGLAVDKGADYKASDFASDLNTALGEGSLSHIVSFENGRYVVYTVGQDANDFSIVPGKGYFVRSTKAGSATISGDQPSLSSISIPEGWSIISLPQVLSGITNSEELLQAMQDAGVDARMLARWFGGRWAIYNFDVGANNFLITPGEGYFIRNYGEAGTFNFP